jgi:protein-S-isoprenylcysteine O-methyltransferase Ste14
VANFFFQRGGWWVLGQNILLVLVIVLGIAWHQQYDHRFATLSGIILLTIGVVVMIAGALSLGRNLTPFPRPSGGTCLVQSGAYRFVRHPLYTALICDSFGWSFLMKSWSATICALAITIVLDRKARVEERWLQQQFPEYRAYQKRVQRFVPWVY